MKETITELQKTGTKLPVIRAAPPLSAESRSALLGALGLKTDATDDEIVVAVAALKSGLEETSERRRAEKRINDKIADSGGALTRNMAIHALAEQDRQAAKLCRPGGPQWQVAGML
jgi:hypothetical protein